MLAMPTNHKNPPKNYIIFEEYFNRKFTYGRDKPACKAEYIPINWTNYYISKNYGKGDLSEAQNYLDELDRTKQYFTIVQWDDGILNDLRDLNVTVFASGGVGDLPIPLSSYYCEEKNKEKTYFAGFQGQILDRGDVRKNLCISLKNKAFEVPIYITDSRYDYDNYLNLLSETMFALAPRGYGKTSFRIYEALMVNSIPVYIYDEPWIPYEDILDFEEYGVLCHESEDVVEKLLSLSSKDIFFKKANRSKVFKEFYTFEGIYNQIIQAITQ